MKTAHLERMYGVALRLYPTCFRQQYADAMAQTFRDALRDGSIRHRAVLLLVVWDLVVSLAKEHFAMMRDSIVRPLLVLNALVLAGIATGVALALYVIPLNVLRSGLNDPQIQLAGDLAARLAREGTLAETAPDERIDMAQSLAPFVIVYDDQGRPVDSQAVLNGRVPSLPRGVFDDVRQHGEDRLSWQPVLGRESGVRIAAVVRRVEGAHPGFVLAGRNMREVEARIANVRTIAGLTWLGMLGLIALGAVGFAYFAQPRQSDLASHPTA
jgi:hypothetical protein